MKRIKSDTEALTVAVNIIDAQDRLLIAYRTGGRTPGAAIDRLNHDRPRLEAYLSKEATDD